MGRPATLPAIRFWAKVEKTEDCWLWTAAANPYGVFASGFGFQVKAHVWSWEQVNGPVPEGKELDHLCRVKRCVRPDHLEPVTKKQNAERAMPFRVINRDAAGRFA